MIMKIKLCLLTLWILFASNLYAQMVTTEVSPPEPLLNESFFVTFSVKTSGDTEPYISFTPSGVQVLGKREQGVSIQTVVINGKFTSTKEQNIVYELVADRAGTAYLRNVKVDIGGKITPVKDIQINILSAPKKIPEAFMEAQVTKTKVYVGEGIDVNYYLYFKNSIAANDVKDFPKLNKFIKRFHHINSPVETVQYKNEVLKRILAYSARVYPEKAGTAIIDPMRISVQVVENDYNGFGFGTQRIKNKDLMSNKIEIEVLPLPTENVPTGFTGLVGEHEFKFTPGKPKYLVNEPIELKLEVSGKGALEKMDAPVLYNDKNLETFDTKAEVTETGNTTAKKVFEYTYLARNSLTIPSGSISLAYFDPATAKYIEKKIEIPGLEVSGTAAPANTSSGTKLANNADNSSSGASASAIDSFLNKWFSPSKESKATIVKGEVGLVGPIFHQTSLFSRSIFNLVNSILLFFVIVASAFVIKSLQGEEIEYVGANKEAKALIKAIKSKGIDHSRLYKLISLLDQKNKMSNGGMSIYDVLESSSLSEDSKKYFKEMLDVCEQSIYGVNKVKGKLDFNSKYFNELLKVL